ncbi:T6SS effector amidase Tae4 family protein [Cronobacter malonaticus]|uniref:T6SS effector amidase Tae4 family protein n=1 Tax=Cronobacter malonaticus TaxID=413503 RepID=UPI002893EF94|nr:T6SS effector amidase Tae4 family protein [Cronobacter malonaticus]ELY6204107.1 hypothetical protein [Cronobacter malonaticus]MDT3559409.1 T6SS effector amidase Tae4 family protein [Cronobacter malonaticus]
MKKIIIANVDGVYSSALIVNRPSWTKMLEHYPSEGVSRKDFFILISKDLAKDADRRAYRNTCALRLSYALNHSGVKLGVPPDSGGMVKGDDGLNYWLRVKELKQELFKLFGNADFLLKYPERLPPATIEDITGPETYANNHFDEYYRRKLYAENNFLSKINNKAGIIVFDVIGWGDATGHFTLWNKGKLLYVGGVPEENDPTSAAYYVWHLEPRYDAYKHEMYLVETTAAFFWELK